MFRKEKEIGTHQTITVDCGLDLHFNPIKLGPSPSPALNKMDIQIDNEASEVAKAPSLQDDVNNSFEETKPLPIYEVQVTEYKPETLANIKIEIEIEGEPYTETSNAESTFVCDHCMEHYNDKSSLERHIACVHNSTVHNGLSLAHLQCTVCDFKAFSKEHLDKHVLLHDEKRKFACHMCSYRFALKRILEAHVQRVHTDRVFQCKLCDFECPQRELLQEHMQIHVGEKLFSCESCDYRCDFSTDLAQHIRIQHTDVNPYVCRLCQYASNTNSNLKKHMKSKHCEDKPYKCHICDYSSSHCTNLKHHLQRHTGDKPFSCNYCGYKCAQKVRLQDHIRVHTGERPFKCQYCDARFIDRSHLRRHIIQYHTAAADTQKETILFKCKLCDHVAKTNFGLREHKRVHTGNWPFKCDTCDFKCGRKYQLTTHYKTHTEVLGQAIKSIN